MRSMNRGQQAVDTVEAVLEEDEQSFRAELARIENELAAATEEYEEMRMDLSARVRDAERGLPTKSVPTSEQRQRVERAERELRELRQGFRRERKELVAERERIEQELREIERAREILADVVK